MKHHKGNVQSARRAFAAANEQAAEIIIRDPARYPAGSLAREWAWRVMSAKETS
jgi:hypothetical protein